MKRWMGLLGCASMVAVAAACDAPGPAEAGGAGGFTGGAGGGTGIPDVPCTDTNGCLRGEVDLLMACTAPPSGPGTYTWEASILLDTEATGQAGSCGVHDNGHFQLTFGLPDSLDGSLRLSGPFSGGGEYVLGGPQDTLQKNGLYLKGRDKLEDAVAFTQVDTSSGCGEDCVLEVLPRDRPVGAPGSWVTYRFVVSCDGPIGRWGSPCSTCTIAPATFTFDAACYFVPPEL